MAAFVLGPSIADDLMEEKGCKQGIIRAADLCTADKDGSNLCAIFYNIG